MRNFKLKNKPAFTMIELVFVIVVLGIIASLALPRLDRDLREEAAAAILSDIRYTQQLAMNDFKHSANPLWQRSFWMIGFACNNSTNFKEFIGSDSGYDGGIGIPEAAIDPANGRGMHSGVGVCNNAIANTISDRILLYNKFSVRTVATVGGCANVQYIGFDHLGRPHVGYTASNAPDYNSYMTLACTFNFTMENGDTFGISIQPETGYAQIVGQDNS
jgi:prepilin-type N-terminal cleavage/methylation domain-containing protein